MSFWSLCVEAAFVGTERKQSLLFAALDGEQQVYRECFFFPFLPPNLNVNRRLCLLATVGYIVGLGDRHIQNILIDEETAELVHIDLGTASRLYGPIGEQNVLRLLLVELRSTPPLFVFFSCPPLIRCGL